MTQLVTRCPKCATAFRITTTQLESARGSVRCGSCLHIFKAQDDLIDTTPKASPFASIQLDSDIDSEIDKEIDKALKLEINSEAESDSSTPSYGENLPEDEDILISDDMNKPAGDRSSYEFEGYVDVDLHPTPTTSLFERNIESAAEQATETADESWAETLLQLEQEQSRTASDKDTGTAAPELRETQTDNPDKSAPQQNAVTIPDEDEYARINREFSTLYKTPLFNLVNEEETAATKKQPPTDVLLSARRDDPLMEDEQTPAKNVFTKGFFRNNGEPEAAQPQRHQPKNQPAIHAAPESRTALLMNIIPSPIEMTAERLRSWSPKALWPSLALAAALALITQIAYFKFDYLSRIEPYRSAYLWLCPVFNCTLPSLVDTSQIKPYQLILRNHPSAANAFIVDVMIRNDAPFEQPFPDLILVFSTIDNTPVASRRFTPQEYLAGEASGRKHMGSRQPFHITLELSRPAPEAVNYHIDIAH
ncbi:MAG TPA: DUF3426 domain-containing protein [Cellvibrio sp.]|nr:DUF3426 domain-containing protein [Cellvibrio sp.]